MWLVLTIKFTGLYCFNMLRNSRLFRKKFSQNKPTGKGNLEGGWGWGVKVEVEVVGLWF